MKADAIRLLEFLRRSTQFSDVAAGRLTAVHDCSTYESGLRNQPVIPSMVSDMHVLPVALERVSKPQDRYLRWFSARRASEFRRAKLGDAQAITVSHIVTSNDGKLAYFKNSKAGCTTVTAAIYQYNYQQPLETNAHSKELDLRQGRQHWEANVDAINNGAMNRPGFTGEFLVR